MYEQIIVCVSGIAENVIVDFIWNHFQKKAQGKCLEVRRYGPLLLDVVFDAPILREYKAVP